MTKKKQHPDCMEDLGDGRYRCTLNGWTIRPKLLPIHCKCDHKPHPPKTIRSRGLGDTIAKVTRAVGIKPCGGCKKRQQRLNQIFPYQ